MGTTAFELTRTNNGGTGQVFILTSAHDDSYADNSNIYNSFGNDGYANTGNDNNGDYGGHYSHSYDDDSSEDTGHEADVHSDDPHLLQSLDEGREGGRLDQHMLHRRSPQDPNALYQFP